MDKLRLIFRTDIISWLLQLVRHRRGSLTVIIFLNTIISLSGTASAIISKYLVDLAVQGHVSRAALFAAGLAAIFAIQLIFTALMSLKSVRLKETMNNDLQRSFMDRLYKSDWGAANKYHSGDIMTRLTSDVANITNGWVTIFPSIIAFIVQLITAFFTLFYLDRNLAMFAFLLAPVSIIISWFIGRKLKRMQHQIQAAESRYRSFLHECAQNLMIIKTFENETESSQKVRHHQQDRLFWVLKRNRFNVATHLTMGVGYRFGFFLAFVWGAYRLSLGATSFGTFTAFLQLVGQIQGPIDGLSRTLPGIIATTASVERLMEFEKLELEAEKTDLPPIMTISALCMDHVAFYYEESRPVLIDADLRIESGNLVALVGTSGEGKTTLIRLLLALIKPQSGSVYVIRQDGEKITLSANSRGYFSYVPQGNTLFSGTISDNLRIGSPTATDEELDAAIDAACARSFIEALPQGIDTVIGERGTGLSEGQAQRLSIARALLRPTPVLLLDEATSALDMDTEWAVLQNIKNLQPPRTCIAITHRLSVFELCDHVYRLSNGRLYEQKKELAPHHE